MMRRRVAAFTVFALLAAGVAPVHALAMTDRAAGPGADLCSVGADRGPGPGAPPDDQRHPCDRCDGCPAGSAATPLVTAAAFALPRGLPQRVRGLSTAMPRAAPAAPLARGPPRVGGSPSYAA